MESFHLVIIGFGEVQLQKYLSTIGQAINNGKISSYSIVDLESARSEVLDRVERSIFKPENCYFLGINEINDNWGSQQEVQNVFRVLKHSYTRIKVFIATEVKAHELYLKQCIWDDIDSLVEKPIIAPFKNSKFCPSEINIRMKHLADAIKVRNGNHSVMCFSRYHKVYNKYLYELVLDKVLKYQAPITSFHLSTNSGVWNLNEEFKSREDHPYKYGYGMLMHGAYHYIDLIYQFLSLNRLVYPQDEFLVTLSSFAAFPIDQDSRIPKTMSYQLEDFGNIGDQVDKYGETDITTTFRLDNLTRGKVLTVGTLCFEQTTPSIRTWKKLPKQFYNKNGRIAATTIEIQLSTIFSTFIRVLKIPNVVDGQINKITNYAEVATRSNAGLLKEEMYNSKKIFDNFTNTESNLELFNAWIDGKENLSRLESHLGPMQIIQTLIESIKDQGYPVSFSL